MEGQPSEKLKGYWTTVLLKGSKRLLSCRFTPAELPLSEAASVVKNYGLERSTAARRGL